MPYGVIRDDSGQVNSAALIPTLASEGTPETQVQPPASAAPARIDQGPRERRRMANKLYRDSQYEI